MADTTPVLATYASVGAPELRSVAALGRVLFGANLSEQRQEAELDRAVITYQARTNGQGVINVTTGADVGMPHTTDVLAHSWASGDEPSTTLSIVGDANASIEEVDVDGHDVLTRLFDRSFGEASGIGPITPELDI